MNLVIEVQDLRKVINGREILKGVSFYVKEGEIFTIIGGSGSGKTSITRCLVGLWKPTAGIVKIFGEDINSLNPQRLDQLRRKIGYVFQGAALFDSLRVWENVVFFYLERGKMKEEELRRIALEKLRLVGLGEEVMDLFPSELSGGMRKRVGIARAIATEPKIIIYDEPTSGLDPITSRLIDRLILDLREKTGTTAVVVSHDLVSAFSISDRLMLLKEGKVVAIGSREDFLRSTDPFVVEFIQSGMLREIAETPSS